METEQRDSKREPLGRKQIIGITFAAAWTAMPTLMVVLDKMQGGEWKAAVAMTAMPAVMGLLGFAAWKDRG